MKKETKNGITYDTFTDVIEEKAKIQVENIVDKFPDAHVAIMPDVHAGEPAPIGLTIRFDELKQEYLNGIIELVGNDIGCGVLGTIFRSKNKFEQKDLEKIYKFIEKNIPIFKNEKGETFGTLGNGNHFIELGEISDNVYMLTVHSGSRAEGSKVFNKYHNGLLENNYREKLIDTMKKLGIEKHIETVLKDIKPPQKVMSDSTFFSWRSEMEEAKDFASRSRKYISGKIINFLLDEKFEIEIVIEIENVHNYFDGRYILRKGAVNSCDYLVLTPLSMGEGVMVSIGFPSEDNNYSAMHGAGRVMSRTEARATISLEDLTNSVKGIVANPRESIIDEAPAAYKTRKMIEDNISDIALPLFIAKPVLNFKGDNK